MAGKKISEERKQAVITMYLNGQTYQQIKEKLHIADINIKKILIENNIPINKNKGHCKYYNDEHFLDELDTPEKNYFVGFFSADGYNSESKNEIIMELQEEDKDFLQKLNSLFNNERPLRIVTKRINDKEYKEARICIHSQHLCEKMKEYNCPQNKTLSYTIPEFYMNGNNIYIKDFIRGYLDADGCIYFNSNTNQLKINICCNYQVCDQLVEILQQQLNINPITYIKSDTIKYVEIKKKEDVLKFCDWIYYDGCFCLERKHEKFLKYINV